MLQVSEFRHLKISLLLVLTLLQNSSIASKSFFDRYENNDAFGAFDFYCYRQEGLKKANPVVSSAVHPPPT